MVVFILEKNMVNHMINKREKIIILIHEKIITLIHEKIITLILEKNYEEFYNKQT